MKSIIIYIFILTFATGCMSYKLRHDPTYLSKKSRLDSKVLVSKTTSFADTTIATVYGHIFGLRNISGSEELDTIKYAVIFFRNSSTSPSHGTNSKMKGEYQMRLQPGIYTVKCSYAGYNTLIVRGFSLKSGEIKQFDIGLGRGGAADSTVYSVNSDNKFVKLD